MRAVSLQEFIDWFQLLAGDKTLAALVERLDESALPVRHALETGVEMLATAFSSKAVANNEYRDLQKFIAHAGSPSGNWETRLQQLMVQDDTIRLNDESIPLLIFLFGQNWNMQADVMAAKAGLKTSSAVLIIKWLALLFPAALVRKKDELRLDRHQIRKYLHAWSADTTHKKSGSANTTSGHMENQHDTRQNKSSLFTRLLPWVVLALAAFGMWYFVKLGT